MKGILVGLVEGEDEPRIAIKVGGGDSLAVPITYALLVYDQLGGLLEAAGAFGPDDDEEDDAPVTVQ